MTNPLLSIVCITYNHEEFITQAIESFLKQKTDFPIEIIIHDDCSTDNTKNIIQEYASKFPELIKPIYQNENQYSLGKKIQPLVFPYCQGKYIALCEGDDYWTDPSKLQKQVRFLEKNTDYSICYHDISILENGQFSDSHVPIYDKEFLTIVDLAKENCIHTPTCVFRNNLFDKFPDFFNSCPAGDYVLHLLNAQHGKIKRLPEKMAVYRRHSGGVWAGRQLSNKLDAWLDVLSPLIAYFKDSSEVQEKLQTQHLNTLLRLLKTTVSEGDKESLIKALEKVDTWEIEHVAQYIIDINDELVNKKNDISNINYLINNISLKDSLRILLKKIYYKLLS